MTEIKTFESEEDLKEHFHSIHDYIRNKYGFYGKTALQFFNFLFVLKLIEPEIKKGNFKSISKCLYSELKEQEKGYERNQLLKDYRRIIYQDAKDDGGIQLRDSIFMSNSFADFDDSKDYLKGLLKKIDFLTPEVLDKFHVQGRVYEYFLGFITQKNSGKKSGSQIDDLGQYFTSRKIVRYCMKKVDPEMVDKKTIPSMGDFFCGSGGFITEYIRYLEHKYPEKINWTNQTKNIFGADTDRDIIKSARVDVMLLTKTFTDTNNSVVSNIKRLNSTFDDDFLEAELCKKTKTYVSPYLKVFYNFTNPPYGGDKGKDKNDKVQLNVSNKQIKHVAYTGSINKVINLDQSSYLIKGDNKETLAVLHGMSVLEKDGVYCGVLKEGVFFDQKFKSLRTQLVENYEVQWVISVPQSDFWNTSTKTSILIFKNSGNKTKEIKFCELQEIKNSSKFNEINPETGKIIGEFNPDNYELNKLKDANYLKVKYDELKEKDFSLNFKDYIKQNIKVNKGFKIVKLGDIIKYLEKSKRKAGDAEENGIYRFYSSSDNIKKCNFVDYNEDLCFIIGTGGKCSLFLDNVFSCSADNFICKTDSIELTTYIYYYLKSNWNDFLKKLLNGSTMGHISKERLNEYQIPIPEDINTIKLYLDYLNPANQTLQTLQTLQTQKEKAICGLIKMLTMFEKDGVEWDEYRLDEICEINPKNEKINYEYVEYLDIGNCLEFNTTKLKNDDKLPSRAKRTIKLNDVLLSSVRPNNKNINIIKKYNYLENLIVSTGFILLRPNNLITSDYLYFYILRDDTTNYFINKSTGSGYPAINVDSICDMKIRVLKPHMITKYKLQEEFDFMDKLKNDISQTLKNQEDITKQMMKLVLGGEEDKSINVNNEKEDDNSSSKSNKSVKSVKSTKSTEKKVLRTRKEVEPETESDNESETDSDDEESQLEKLGVSKADLTQFKKLTKDGCSHWFHSPTEKIFTHNKENKWVKGKTKLYDVYADEIEEFKEAKEKQKTTTKSTKSSKSKEVKETKEKKNKSTKSNVVVSNSDTEDDKQIISQGQNVLKYKSKAKSNSKYISDSDEDTDLDELERELKGKK